MPKIGVCDLVSQSGHRAKTENTKVIQESTLLWKKEVMSHQSSKAFSEEFVTIFVAGSGQ